MRNRQILKSIYINFCGFPESQADDVLRYFFMNTDVESEIEYFKNLK